MPKKTTKTPPIATSTIVDKPSTTPTLSSGDTRSIEERVYDVLRRLAVVYQITKAGEVEDTDSIPILDEHIGRNDENANMVLIQTGIADLVHECLEALAPILSAPSDVTQWSPERGAR